MLKESVLGRQILAILILLAAWEILPRCGVVNPLFIPPLSVVLAALRDINASGELLTHTVISLQRAFFGFSVAVLVGLPLGLLLGGWFPRIQQALEPLMELFAQANPVILAHIIIFFIGIGEGAKTFVIAWLCVWPITFSAITGIRTVDPVLLKAAGSFGLGRWRLFVRVVIPAAAPSIFTGLRLAAGYAFIMLIASEMMGASSGLGWLVVQSQESYNVSRMFAGAGMITLLAVVADALLRLVEKRVVVWDATGSEDYLNLRGAR
jgi:ABC-type nitrate/sulfonate/bicarbonate transport system permease component